MQVNRLENYNAQQNPAFQGQFNIGTKKFFAKMINQIESLDLERIGTEVLIKEQKNKPAINQSFFSRIKDIFSQESEDIQAMPDKKELQVIGKQKIKDYWDKILKEMKYLATKKLPDEYVVKGQKSNLGPNSINFSITEGKEHIYGVSADIDNPNFVDKYFIKNLRILSDPEFKTKIDDLKEIIPNLTLNEYFRDGFGQFSMSILSKWAETNKELQKMADAKKMNLSIKLNKDDEYNYYKSAKVILKDKDGTLINHYVYNLNKLEYAEKDITKEIKKCK